MKNNSRHHIRSGRKQVSMMLTWLSDENLRVISLRVLSTVPSSRHREKYRFALRTNRAVPVV